MDFHSRYWGYRDFGSYNHGGYGQELRPSTLSSVSDLPSALELPLQLTGHGMSDGIETNHPSPSNLSSIYAGLTKDGSPSNYPYRIQSTPPAQAAKYAIGQTGIYFGFNPRYPQYPIRQEQQQASFQSRGFYPSLTTGNPPPSPLRPYCRPARLVGKRGDGTNYSNPGSHTCHICGIRFKRPADLYRHLKTTRKHRSPHGPVCPELGCKFTARFTRVDNFRAHYRRLHGKSDDEANWFIREWKG
ncbi:hypothetical protein HOY80DRAFT_1133481 [Tuber brumale]|nr:hypothetical protein HOY80DRAFT_1133481 [Tuber brumale]